MDTSPPPLLVETHGLTKRFGARTAVDNVDLRIPVGCAFGLLGPNGAGKTTLIRTLMGLTPASAGTMRMMGCDVPRQRAEALAHVGAVIEEPRFHGHLTGRENLLIIAAVLDDAATKRIPAVLERVGLAARADERVKGYSLGMRQRLGIARCLLNDPRLLVLDEPMNGLDPAGIIEFRGLIRSFVAEGRTVLISSHLLDEIERTCDMVAILDRGKLIRQGTLGDLRQDNVHRVVLGCDDNDRARALLDAIPTVTAVADSDDGTLVLTLAAATDAAGVNRVLVEAGLAVSRLEPSRFSLEERFLDITTRLQAPEEVPA